MKKKIYIVILTLLLALLALVSCEGLFGGGGQNENEKTVFSSIIHDGTELDFQNALTQMRDIVGPMVTVNLYSDRLASDGEVVFGNTDRAITLAAKAELEAQLSKSQRYDCGYIIYTDGKSIAVYWDVDGMEELALKSFIDIVLEEKRLDVEAGTVAYKYYVKREFESEKYWLALETKVDTDVVNAIRSLYNYFDGHKLAGWMANLYDPEIGGFYYSNSARDNAGYLPDIESTSQLIGTAVSIGVLSNRNEDIPNEIKAKLVSFAKSLQSSDDGYFYHPQWPSGRENLQTDRYGRDLDNSTNLITSFKLDMDGDGVGETAQYPNWCAPNGVKCALHTGTDEKCSFPITVSAYSDRLEGTVTTALASSVSSAVSKLQGSVVAATASVSSHPDYSSAADFETWLRAYNSSILENSGNAHNLSAIQSEIVAQGYGKIVLDFLDEKLDESYANQVAEGNEEPTGLWQSEINYTLVWSLLKYATWYNSTSVGRAFPEEYIPYAVKSCIKVTALEPDGAYRMNDLYNQWTSIQSLLTNIDRYYPESKKAETKELIYSIVRDNAAELIENSLSKIEPFKMEDGSFAYQSSGNSMTTIYGVPIAMGVREGDVNAVALVTGMYKAIFTCLGLSAVPLCNEDDREFFISELLSCEPVNKQEQADVTLTFENAGMPQEVTSSFTTSEASLAVVEDPDNSSNRVLSFVSGVGTTAGDYLRLKATSHGSSCFIFETDIYVSSDSVDGYLFQIMVGNQYMLTIYKNGTTVTLKDAPSTSHSDGMVTRATFTTDEWHRIRVEYYVHGETTGLEVPNIKIWFDDEFVGVSNNWFGSDKGTLKTATFNQVEIYSMRSVATSIYLDNCFVSTDDKEFDDTDGDITDYRDALE